jgi:hypothetical protein
MITSWIDGMQDMWRGITGDGFDTVFAPYLVKRAEFPSAIDPKTLARQPTALSIPGEFQFQYSAGGQQTLFVQGVTEFHVAPSLDMGLIPSLMQWPGLIAAKAAANMKLGGLVHNFVLQARDDQITGPVELKFGDEQPHWGFIAYWEVKEIVNGSITVATGE